MKAIVTLSFSILFLWFLITRFALASGRITLNEETMRQLNIEMIIKRVLWVIMMTLQEVLSYRLYKLIPEMNGLNKTGAKLYFGIVILLLLISFIIFTIGLTSFCL